MEAAYAKFETRVNVHFFSQLFNVGSNETIVEIILLSQSVFYSKIDQFILNR